MLCSTDSSCSAPRFDVPCVRASTSSGNTSDCPSSLRYSGRLIYEGSGSACQLETGESNFLLGNLSVSRKGSVFIHKCATPGGAILASELGSGEVFNVCPRDNCQGVEEELSAWR